MVSSCHWGCRAVPARALQGRGGDGEGEGRLGSEGYSPGTQGTGRQTRELGSGAEAPGAGRAAMAEPGADVNSVLQSLACMAPPLPDNHPPLLGLLAHQPVRLVSHRPRPLSASDLLSLRFLLSVQGLLCSPELTRHGLRHLMFGAWLQCCPSGIFPTFLQLRENGFLYKHTISRSDVSTAHCQLERI